MGAQNINNPNAVNSYIDRLQQRELGYEEKPIISNANFSLGSGQAGLFCYAIKADGAAPVVITAITDRNGQAYSLPGDITILAGDVLLMPCTAFTVSGSGIYIAYLALQTNP